jgi:glycerol uptake facilitator protein
MRLGQTQRLVAELIGTLFLVFFGAGAAIAAAGGLVGVAFAHAIALAVGIWAFGPVSGGYFNPGITLAVALRGRLSWSAAVQYVIVQLVGGFAAALLLWAVFGKKGINAGLGATHVSAGVSTISALVAEIIGTFLLASAVYFFGVNARIPAGVAPLGIGLSLGAAILALGPLTGASLNFARTFGPELVLGLGGGHPQWSQIWIYIVGPLIGAVLAVYAYDLTVTPATPTPPVEPVVRRTQPARSARRRS